MPDPTPQTATASGPWQPPSAEELQALLPQYEITMLLGRGGMGAVYKGTQIALERPVAIKILSNQLEEATASFAARFKNEAKAMAKLSHPGIVAVHDFGEAEDGLLYIVMEFIEGTDVSRMISQQKRLHPEHAMAITAHVCDALAYAHERGIIHRDIKPANIMVGYDGVVKVADFGLAKMTHSQNSGLTQSGMMMGTLQYMAPEALMLGSAVDHRADIYAVGVMLYQMLTGQLPQGVFKLPSKLVEGLDPRYDAIIAKAMCEDRDARYPSVRELRGDLDHILTKPVLKVEPDATHAPPALPTQARPQRPEGQPEHPPELVKPKAGMDWLWITVLVVSVFGGIAWLVLGKFGGGSPATEEHEMTAAATPATSDPKQATKEKPFENSLGMRFVPVPGTDVLFSIWHTRVQDWEKFEQSNSRAGKPDSAKVLGPTHPMTYINWADAKEFCVWLTEEDRKQGRIGAEQEYRLPTDAEWSVAVGLPEEKGNTPFEKGELSSNENTFPWGASWPPPKGAGNYSKVLNVDDFLTTSPVGSFAPNDHGLYDMSGNLWQWCEDEHGEPGKEPGRVKRGGFYGNSTANFLRSSYRARGDLAAGRSGQSDGFRCVLAISSSQRTTLATSPPQAPAVAPAASTTPAAYDPKQATKEKPFENSLGMKFVPVPITGGPTDTKQSGKRVFFCIHETRKRDYAVYATANSGVDTRWKWAAGDDHPVSAVSCEEAKKFCEWLSNKEGLSYRLPSDHEWSCAVGIGELEDVSENGSAVRNRERTKGIYPWGTQWPPPKGAGNYDPSLGVDDFERTAPVMQFAPNQLGIYDLGGNVGEFCEVVGSSVYSPTNQYPFRARGGIFDGFVSPEQGLLSSSRVSCPNPDNHNGSFGFRCVLVTDEVPAAVSSGSSTSDSKLASKEKPFENSLGMRFVPVPGTKVLFSVWETRVKDYSAFADTAKTLDETWTRQTSAGIPVGREPEHPVCAVSWYDAKAFSEWLTQKEVSEARLEKGAKYRLPTDEEWSLAIGLPDEKGASPLEKGMSNNSRFPWKGAYPPQGRAGNYADATFNTSFPGKDFPIKSYVDGFATTAPVGSFEPNEFGIFDLGGNVWEWCEDWSDSTQTTRVLRGASWNDASSIYLRSSVRQRIDPSVRQRSNDGFRVVLELAGSLLAASGSSVAPIPTYPQIPSAITMTASATRSPAINLSSFTKEKPFENSLGMRFVPVPGTTALFSVWETRVRDFQTFAASPGSILSASSLSMRSLEVNDQTNKPEWKQIGRTWESPGFAQTQEHPVVGVTWVMAKEFCRWLTEKERNEGMLDSREEYRLPTDEEWSMAAGLPTEYGDTPLAKSGMILDHFAWGTTWPPKSGSGNYAGMETTSGNNWAEFNEFIAGYTDGHPRTSPVGAFEPNKSGLWDMGGNVWELCEDWSDGVGIYDPKRLPTRVMRGASWNNSRRDALPSSKRFGALPDSGKSDTGFRCVLASANVSPKSATTASTVPPVATPEPAVAPTPGSSVITLPDGPTKWTDTNGRILQATFKAIQGDNVMLDIAGKIRPVPLKLLSPASQKMARDYQQQTKPSPAPTTTGGAVVP